MTNSLSVIEDSIVDEGVAMIDIRLGCHTIISLSVELEWNPP
jgi:hypothetical protein